jgi:hypothetical protein
VVLAGLGAVHQHGVGQALILQQEAQEQAAKEIRVVQDMLRQPFGGLEAAAVVQELLVVMLIQQLVYPAQAATARQAVFQVRRLHTQAAAEVELIAMPPVPRMEAQAEQAAVARVVAIIIAMCL